MKERLSEDVVTKFCSRATNLKQLNVSELDNLDAESVECKDSLMTLAIRLIENSDALTNVNLEENKLSADQTEKVLTALLDSPSIGLLNDVNL